MPLSATDFANQMVAQARVLDPSFSGEVIGYIIPEMKRWERQIGQCIVDGCERPKKTNGYCAPHYGRLRKTGSLQSEKPIEARGTERPFPNADGYLVVRVRSDSPLYRGQKVFQHRLVMARHLGRELYAYETVHHRNGNRSDNHLANLELWVGNHSHGGRLDDRLADAVTLIEQYAEQLSFEQLELLRCL